MTPGVETITGLILAGGRGSRMAGADKGLQKYRGVPLVQHALQRLAPQVARVAVSANRNLPVYAALGVAVWADDVEGFQGPLAGMLSGLRHCDTGYLAVVPCDSPQFPLDLVARLALGMRAHAGAEIAVAATAEAGQIRLQPVFCLLGIAARASLAAFLASGERKTDRWIRSRRYAQVLFEDPSAFQNINTLAELDSHPASD